MARIQAWTDRSLPRRDVSVRGPEQLRRAARAAGFAMAQGSYEPRGVSFSLAPHTRFALRMSSGIDRYLRRFLPA